MTAPSDDSPRFDPSTDVVGNEINLPYVMLDKNGNPLVSGDNVVYSDGGAAPIGGLGDGGQYTLRLVSGNTWELETQTATSSR